MMKPTDSQQVESKKTTEVSQQVESDTTPHTPGSSISFEVPPTVTQDENHVADKITEDTENEGQVMHLDEKEETHRITHGLLQI